MFQRGRYWGALYQLHVLETASCEHPGGCNSVVKGTPRLSILFHRIPFSLTFYLAKDPLSRKIFEGSQLLKEYH